eukprot:9469205-Pyramimonas_sp.AAC.1
MGSLTGPPKVVPVRSTPAGEELADGEGAGAIMALAAATALRTDTAAERAAAAAATAASCETTQLWTKSSQNTW